MKSRIRRGCRTALTAIKSAKQRSLSRWVFVAKLSSLLVIIWYEIHTYTTVGLMFMFVLTNLIKDMLFYFCLKNKVIRLVIYTLIILFVTEKTIGQSGEHFWCYLQIYFLLSSPEPESVGWGSSSIAVFFHWRSVL